MAKINANSIPKRSVVEILTGALKAFGPNGKSWNNATIRGYDVNGHDTYCALGGLQMGALDHTTCTTTHIDGVPNYTTACELVHQAIKEEFPADSNKTAIHHFNDTRRSGAVGFRQIKKAFCSAIKKAVELEDKNG